MKELIGKWKSINCEYDLINTFTAQGTMTQADRWSKGNPCKFTIEGNNMIFFIEQPDGSIHEEKTKFELSDGIMTFIYSPKSKIEFVKMEDKE